MGFRERFPGQSQWLTSVIQAFWEAEVGGLPRSGIQDQPGQHGETTKNIKINQVRCTLVILATREAEAGESLEPREVLANLGR